MISSENPPTDLLQNREMVQVAIGTYQIQFGFDRDLTISVESCFTYTSGAEVVEWQPGKMQAAAATVSLIGHSVERAEKVKVTGLRLYFSNGDLLTITPSDGKFESYQVTGKDFTFVV